MTYLSDLPKTTKSGWPWTLDKGSVVDYSAVSPILWPSISIVTPSFNQAQYLEETIRSVLLQGYPNLDYVIIDGGSSDGSIEIIKKYEPWLTYWISEKDDGQSQAINKGFLKTHGEIMAWINSDDTYAPGALKIVAETFLSNHTLYIAGITHKVNSEGEIIQIGKKNEPKFELWYVGAPYQQQSIFWHRDLWNKAGILDEKLHYSFDYDLWMRFITYQPFATWIDQHLANFRIHAESKTSVDQLKFIKERQLIYNRYPIMVKGFSKHFFIWKMRRERKSRIYKKLLDSMPLYKVLFQIFVSTPWWFINIEFLYWIKKNFGR